MVTFEVFMEVAASIGVVTSALFGGGLFRQALKHSSESAVTKFRQEQAEKKSGEHDLAIQELKQEMALVQKDIDGFSSHIRKLDFIPEIMAKLSGIETSIQYMKEQIKDLRVDHQEHDRNS